MRTARTRSAAFWATMMLALGADAGRAAVIAVDGTTCSLANAILSANSDSAVGGCAAGARRRHDRARRRRRPDRAGDGGDRRRPERPAGGRVGDHHRSRAQVDRRTVVLPGMRLGGPDCVSDCGRRCRGRPDTRPGHAAQRMHRRRDPAADRLRRRGAGARRRPPAYRQLHARGQSDHRRRGFDRA